MGKEQINLQLRTVVLMFATLCCRRYTTFSASSELPGSVEEAVVFWINKTCAALANRGDLEIIQGESNQKVRLERVQISLWSLARWRGAILFRWSSQKKGVKLSSLDGRGVKLSSLDRRGVKLSR